MSGVREYQQLGVAERTRAALGASRDKKEVLMPAVVDPNAPVWVSNPSAVDSVDFIGVVGRSYRFDTALDAENHAIKEVEARAAAVIMSDIIRIDEEVRSVLGMSNSSIARGVAGDDAVFKYVHQEIRGGLVLFFITEHGQLKSMEFPKCSMRPLP